MAIPAQPTKPNRLTQTQAEFSANSSNIVEWMGEFADDLNSVSSTYHLSVSGTSVTSNSIGTGARTFTTQTGLGFVVGQTLRIANSATNTLTGNVTSYTTGTGVLVMNITGTAGSGTFTSWTISLGAVGASAASDISFTPTGNLSSTTVQAMGAELDAEKLSSADGAVTSAKLADIITGATVGSIANIPIITHNAKGQITGTSTASKIVLNTPVATTSGTSVTLTSSIPATAKRINLTFNGVSLNAADNIIIRLNNITSGYNGSGTLIGTGINTNDDTSGFRVSAGSPPAARTFYGHATILLHEASSHIYTYTGMFGTESAVISFGAGTKDLASVLTTITILSAGGTATFDAGNVAVSWE